MNLLDTIDFRKRLHLIAELSGKEEKTSALVKEEFKKFNPDKIIENIGGQGIAFVFNENKAGKKIMLRAELDALPIHEINSFEYKSITDNVSHKCGHDGHMSILRAVAEEISKIKNKLTGSVILFFQPAEETAQGARKVVNDKKFDEIIPDYIFALHNLPGFENGSIIVRRDVFASASIGISIKLVGTTSHAAHPKDGRNPALAVSHILSGLVAIPSMNTKLEHSALITPIYTKLGEIAFGTSAGDAIIMATLRTYRDEDMEIIKNKAIKLVNGIASTYELESHIEWVEDFPATVNDDSGVDILLDAINKAKMDYIMAPNPFPWSEDFSFYSNKTKAVFFGLGAGITHPQLHNKDYDYPDEITEDGVKIFMEIIKSQLM